jgi:hypothetical protein
VPLYLQKKKKKKKTMAETTASTPCPPPFQDPNHHFYLRHSNHLGMVLVSQPLNGENYQQWRPWSQAIIMVLNAKNKPGFVDGTISLPATSSNNFSHWSHCNNMIKILVIKVNF